MAEIQGFHIVDDSYSAPPSNLFGTGYQSRDFSAEPMWKCGTPSTITTMSEKEIIERIAEQEAKKTRMIDHADRVGLKAKNQTSSSFCHVHAPVHGMEYRYILAHGKLLVLSAFYPGAHVTGGRNVGGSGITDIKFLASHGTCLESLHPPLPDRNAFSVDNNPEHVANAARHKIATYEDLDPSDMLAIYTRIVLGIPVTVGIPAWGHEVLLTFLVVQSGKIYPGFDNSWGPEWGTEGRGVLSGAKMRFDEAGAIEECTPANG